MTLLEEHASATRTDIPRPRGRLVAWVIAGAILAAAVGALVYRANYQPLTAGLSSGAGLSTGIMALGDGLQTTRWVVAEPGGPAYFKFSVANRGRHAVKVLSIGDRSFDPQRNLLGLGVRHIGDPRSQCCTDFDSLPFAPFELEPGQERLIRVTVAAVRCRLSEEGGYMTRWSIPMRYQAWGHRTTAELAIPYPLVRYCTPGQIQPPTFPSLVSGDSVLVPTGYGFAVPRGWTTTERQAGHGRTWLKRWTAPGGRGKVELQLTMPETYHLNDQLTPAEARAATGCELAAFEALTASAFSYTCTAPAGTMRSGVIRSGPSGHDVERVEIVSPDASLVAAFLKSIKA